MLVFFSSCIRIVLAIQDIKPVVQNKQNKNNSKKKGIYLVVVIIVN